MRTVLGLTRQYRARMVLGILCGFIAGLTNPLLMGSVKLVFEVVFPESGTPSLAERLQGFSLITPGDVRDFPALLQQLRAESNDVSRAVWDAIPERAKPILSDPQTPATELKTVLIEELNRVLRGGTLDPVTRFTNVVLSAETRALAAASPADAKRTRLHLLLLQDAFPSLKPKRLEGVPEFLRPGVAAVRVRLQKWTEAAVERMKPLLQSLTQDRSPRIMALVIATIPLAMLLRGLFTYLNIYLMSWVSVRAVADLRTRLFTHLMTLSATFFNKVSTGELMSRLNEIHSLHNTISQAMVVIIKEPVTLAGLTVFLLWQQPKLTLVALIIFPITLIPFIIYARKVRKSSVAIYKKHADMGRMMHESFTGYRIIKAYNLESKVIDEFAKTSRAAVSHFMRVLRSMEIPGPLMEFFGAVGVACFFIHIALFSRTTPGGLIVFVGSIFMMYQPIKSLIRLHNQLQQAEAASQYAFQILQTKSTIPEAAHPKPLSAALADIEIDGVHFSYGDKLALHGINLTVKAGQMVALVGSSGSGKTTLTNLLLRFYDPDQGAIRIGGVDIREAALADLRRQIAIVTQETVLFNDTIENNIAAGRPGATRKEVMAAAKHAFAHDFIMEKTGGYDAMIGEKGIALSGGQRQRIAIARAILKNAPILILDEATSSLDSESERAIQETLDELMQHRTTFCIAHRLSTIRHADLIVVLEGGRIVEAGRHGELLGRDGVYRKLHDVQFKV